MHKGNIFFNLTTIIVVEDNYVQQSMTMTISNNIRPTQAKASTQRLGTAWVSTNEIIRTWDGNQM